ncbi:MAG: hypothetical protein JRG80_11815 [Deltaproteobacteria bacterium]|nr:hypothetical protein [Deltaproteobacteria bacterium]
MIALPPSDAKAKGNPSDPFLFAAHDGVNVLVLLFVLGLPHADPSLLVQDYTDAKVLHLLGVGWFYGGLITSTVAVSRFIWMQPALDHDKLAHGFRFLLVLEVFCIPSIILIAYAGMAMVSHLGGFESQPWAHQGYLALLYSPVALMITPRLYHKRLIRNPNVDIERERRLAFWLDWSFIIVMTLGIGFLAASMVRKTALF